MLRLVCTLVALDVVGRMKLLTRFDVFDAMPFKFVSFEFVFAIGFDNVELFDSETELRNAGLCGDIGGVIDELDVFLYD